MSINQDLFKGILKENFYKDSYGKIGKQSISLMHCFFGDNRIKKAFKRTENILRRLIGENKFCTILANGKIYARKLLGERSSISSTNSRESTLYSFYDLDTVNPTFNFLQYLVLSEYYRIQTGLKYNHICIVPSELKNISTILCPHDSSIQKRDIQWRIMTIILPTLYFFDSFSSITLFNSRNEANNFIQLIPKNIFPENYRIDFPISTFTTYNPLNKIADDGGIVPDLHAHRKAIELIEEWIKNNCLGKKIVTITIRECSYLNERNSNLALYADFISKLNRNRFTIIILRDTEKIYSPIPDEFRKLSLIYFDASHIHIRMALYEKAYLNIGDSGPIILCFHNKDIRVLLYGLDKSYNFKDDNEYSRGGYRIAENLPFMGPFQKIIWERNNETLHEEFLKLCQKIDTKYENTITPE